ncbi:cation:proton antiporter [Nocardia brasiliensis]|uniref:cation:proton antiporter n=1 Tax=Nocardia brasiliensis TaxID=37326 RepID=UPI001894B5DD|nr:cation:proton antiporter [Nocardia brasiliensis]MBF6130548.1 cation:proton antiporter [Nocardia brasiliensis]MBF6544724.1 cation:proton antiporter [Nocardia brasiliensis]
MFIAIAATMTVILIWSCLSRTMARWKVTAPLAMVVVGAVVSWSSDHWLTAAINTDAAQRIVEFILALFLFTDATEVRDGLSGRRHTGIFRLLFLAFPLSLGAAYLLGFVLLPGVSWTVLLLIACIVIPIDLVPAQAIVRDLRVPERVRHALNVESGFNDGLVAPIFLFALAAAEASADSDQALNALGHAVPAVVKSILIGLSIGALAGYCMTFAARKRWTDARAVRIGTIAIPVLTYSVAVWLDGNGFVAAFLAGIAYSTTRHELPGEPLQSTEDVAEFSGLAMWFIVGNVAAATLSWLSWQVVVYGLLALTLVRLVPVALSLLGSPFTRRERLMIGLLGPRGVASIVFALLAFNGLRDDDDAFLVIGVTLVVVVGSVILHGVGAPLIAERLGKRRRDKGIAAGA